MVETTGSSPVYVGGNESGFGNGGGFIWAFLIFALLAGNGGFGLGNNGNTNAVQADVNRGFDNQNLQAQTRDILTAVTSGTAQTISASTQNASNAITAIKDGNANIIREFGNVETALTALSGKQQECCCEQKMLTAETGAGINANIAQNRYDAAMNTAAINANTTAQTQKILDAIQQNKIEALQGKVSQLELQNAMSGVLKYPNSWAYNAGNSPFCNCNNGYAYPTY